MSAEYTKEENQCLLDELSGSGFAIRRESFDGLYELWSGLFRGRERSKRGLFIQMVRLAKRNKIPFTVVSAPKRIRNRYKKIIIEPTAVAPALPTKRAPKKPRLQEQMLAILRKELGFAEKRAARKIVVLVSGLNVENAMLKAEIKELRTFKRDSEVTRNNGKSPLMERHYLKAGD